MKFLVVGYLEYDSGKTVLALSLVRLLSGMGRKVLPTKPIAAHSVWHQYQTVVNSRRLGLLVGWDAYRLAEAVGALNAVHVLNPIDLLISPLDPARSGGVAERPLNVALMRLTYCSRGPKVNHFICDDTVEAAPKLIAEEIRALAGELKPRPERVNLEEALNILEREAARVADECLTLVEEMAEDVVIESFNNAAVPTPRALPADYVLAVSPGRVDLYGGERYGETVAALWSIGRAATLTVNEVTRYLKPIDTEWIKPAAENYEAAYEEALKQLLTRGLEGGRGEKGDKFSSSP